MGKEFSLSDLCCAIRLNDIIILLALNWLLVDFCDLIITGGNLVWFAVMLWFNNDCNRYCASFQTASNKLHPGFHYSSNFGIQRWKKCPEENPERRTYAKGRVCNTGPAWRLHPPMGFAHPQPGFAPLACGLRLPQTRALPFRQKCLMQ